MKVKLLIPFFAFCGMLSLMSSCSSEEIFSKAGGFTAFTGGKITESPIMRVPFEASDSIKLPGFSARTSMERTVIGGVGSFLWEPGDYVYIQDDSDKFFKSQNELTEAKKRSTFFVKGAYTDKSSYEVYYNGTESGSDPTKVTIAAVQTQSQFNSTKHFGAAGDCGVAVAKKNTGVDEGGYNFDLAHKASYLCFLPFISNQAQRGSFKIKSIELNSNDNIAGTYDLSSDGLSGSGSSKKILLRVGDQGQGLALADQSAVTKKIENSLYVVIAPGTHSISVKYTVFDTKTNETFSVSKNYGSRTLEANKIYDIAVDLGMTAFSGGHQEANKFHYTGHEIYMWDAQENYWSGYEWDSDNPKQFAEDYRDYEPKSKEKDPKRWFNDKPAPGQASTPLFQKLPNVNEALWYVKKGDAHYDDSTKWTIYDKTYTGGIWLKKLDVIARENGKTREELKAKAPNGLDYRIVDMNEITDPNVLMELYPLNQPAPSMKDNYIFIPFGGGFSNKMAEPGSGLWSWTSSMYNDSHLESYSFVFVSYISKDGSNEKLMLAVDGSYRGDCLQAIPFE